MHQTGIISRVMNQLTTTVISLREAEPVEMQLNRYLSTLMVSTNTKCSILERRHARKNQFKDLLRGQCWENPPLTLTSIALAPRVDWATD